MKCLDTNDMALYVTEQLDPEREAAIQAHLSSCSPCRELYQGMEACERALIPDLDELADVDLAPSIMEVVRAEKSAGERRQPFWTRWTWLSWRWLAVPATALVAVGLGVGVWISQREAPSPDGGFQARGSTPDQVGAWTGFSVFRRTSDAYEPVLDRFSSSDFLAFSYTSAPESRVRFLMLFAVDQSGRISWFYPADDGAADDPCSRSIESTGEAVRLPDEVRQDVAPGPLKIWGLFTAQPLCVRQVETLFRRQAAQAGAPLDVSRLPLTEGVQQTLLLRVE